MKKILIIEDERVLQKTLGDTLRKENYEVFSALDGEMGLKLLESQNFDLIILDLLLPQISGFEVLKRIKENEKTKNIPVIILTNFGSAENVDKALELGVTTYLVKTNYSLPEVVEKVKKSLL